MLSSRHFAVCFRRLAAAVALPVLASGCVSADALTPHAPNTLDAALADLAHPALDNVAAIFSGAGVILPPIDPARCSFDAASQSFACSPRSAIGLTLTQRFELLDATGAKQSAFDPATTTGLHLANTVSGAAVQGNLTTTVDGQQVLDLAGLGTARHTLNGTSFTVVNDGSPSRRASKTVITDLVIPVVAPGLPMGWPLSGTIDFRSLDENGNLIPTSGSTATMRFNGSSVVTVTFLVPGGVLTCHVDLAIQQGWGWQQLDSGVSQCPNDV